MGNKQIGNRIKMQREKRGYAQEEFAQLVDLSPNYLSAVERGVKFPRIEKLILIINTLQCSADELFCDVIDYGYNVKLSELSELFGKIPISEHQRFISFLEVMLLGGVT